MLSLEPGKILNGKYEIIGKLTIGGMGVLYKAKHIHLENYLAIKVVDSNSKDYEEKIKAIENEIVVLSNLKNENIVKIIDYFKIDNTQFIVYEYIEGITVKLFLTSFFNVDINKYPNLYLQILKAIDYIHKSGYVYNDISPSNIMVDFKHKAMKIKIIDFGLAKKIGFMGDKEYFLGKLKYANPELVFNKPLYPQSDIFSLGLLFYEMLTGESIYKNISDERIIFLLSEEKKELIEQSPLEKNTELIIKKMLKKNLNERYKNCEEIICDLKKIGIEMVENIFASDTEILYQKQRKKSVFYHKPKKK